MPQRRLTRKPTRPKPAHRQDLPAFNDLGRGFCRWCGEPIFDGDTLNLRRKWHPHCVAEYQVRNFASVLRRAVWQRDKGRCAQCGARHKRGGDWHADHITPLVDGGSKGLENVQTLCAACHRLKTADEARQRAGLRPSIEAHPKLTAAINEEHPWEEPIWEQP